MHPRLKPLLRLALLLTVIVLAMNSIALLIGSPRSERTTLHELPAPEEPAGELPAARAFAYIEVVEGCGPYFGGSCLNARSGPGTEYPAVLKLRTGIVLRSAGIVEADGRRWHKVVFDEWLRYPERAAKELYVAADYVRAFTDEGPIELAGQAPKSAKRIVVDRSDQELTAFDGETIFMREKISTGLELTPTPRGTFKIFRKTPSRYMQGPIPGISEKVYDLPGVPWNMYFTEQGAAIHGTYWHDHFGQQWSSGCVNLPLDKAQELYAWAELGTTVIVRD